MAEYIKSIVNLKSLGYHIEQLKRMDKRTRDKAIHNTVIEELETYLESEVNYFLDFDSTYKHSTNPCIYGFKQPKDIIQVANEWNKNLAKNAHDAIKELEQFTQAQTGNVHLADAIYTLEEKFESREAARTKEGQEYEMLLYKLRHAIGALDGRFLYGDNVLAIPERNEFCTKLTTEQIQDVHEHPKNYAVIYTFYN